ncbi:MAG: hypothetical protein MUE85_11330 [Microscillaceae bacterium]|jgi:hypothetical protein|nr:hypothetical protein [Microscillaceae bacterium]
MNQKIVFLSLLVSFLAFWQVQAQDASFELQSRGAEQKHFVSIKGEPIQDGQKYPYIFSNLSQYKIKIRPPRNQTVIMKILDKDGKQVAMNLNPRSRKYIHTIIYNCRETGMYYLMFEIVK